MATNMQSTPPVEDILTFRPNPRVGGRPIAKIGGRLVILGETYAITGDVRAGESWRVRLYPRPTFYLAEPLERVHSPRPNETAPTAQPGESLVGPMKISGMLVEPHNVLHPEERIALFIDAPNIERAVPWEMDYEKILSYFLGQARFSSAFYHTIDDDVHRVFHDRLSHVGYTVRRKRPWKTTHANTGVSCLRADMGIDLALDVVSNLASFDVAFIFTGDSEYAPLVTWAQSRGKRVYVVSHRAHVSGELAYVANKPVFHLEDFQELLQRHPREPSA